MNSHPHTGRTRVVVPAPRSTVPVTRSPAFRELPSASPVGLLLLLPLLAHVAAASPALAQIEGYGKDTTGGAGHAVCTVTSSAETGPGTWNSCVRKGGNQTIQFAVPIAKVYETSYLRSNTTVDGCANGQNGIILDQPANKKRAVAIEGPVSNVIVRCIRFRGSGPDHRGFAIEDDLLRLDGTGGLVSRVVVDHCTFIGSTDGALDTTGYVSDVTESWNLFYGTPLTQLIKYKTRQRISLHHNVYTAGGERNPEIKGDARTIDFVSNAVYKETIARDGLGNTFNPYGTRLWNANSRSDSPGNVRVNVRSSFYGGPHTGLQIETEPGASPDGIYIAPDNVCAEGRCPRSPAGAPSAVPAAYAVTATPVGCMAYQMLPSVGSPNRTTADVGKVNAVIAALPHNCPQTLTVTRAGIGSGGITSSAAGISCGTDCSRQYHYGTVVTLSPAPATGSRFAVWSGACAGTGTCHVTMNAAKSVTGTFNLIPYPLAVAKRGTGSGAVTSSVAGINCGADCSQAYNYGTVVTLSKSAAVGSFFAGWGGACTGTGTCQVTVNGARSVTATFNLIPYPLTVAKAGTGSGAVTASPAGIGCGGGCSHAAHAYDYGTTVTLSESPAGGSSFAGWSGACTGTGACRVSMTAARSVTAVFSRVTYTLAVAKTGTGSGTVVSTPAGVSCGSDCSQPYNSGTTVVLTADTATGSRFGGWSGACTGTGSCQVTMNAARSVTASFVKSATASLQSNEDENTLDVAIEGDGSGKVFSSPAGIDCGHDCATAYPRGSTVSVAATADPGSTFRGWRGACSGTGSCQLEMSQGRNVVATFSTPSPGGFYTVEPCRVLDTRLPSGPNGGPPLPAHMTRVFPLFGVCGIPTSARAVSLNVTVTEATSAGHLRVFPAGVPLPAAMSLSYAAGRTRANNVTAGLSRSGGLAIRGDQASGAVHVIVDVNGYYE